tara:strand:- start:1476 stop:1865 length:390 start_codon:yes stop_codon:yes gene_type:complete
MTMLRYVLLLIVMTTSAHAHEMVPTYPKLKPSYIEGLHQTAVTIFNKREDVEYYEIGAFTKDWKPIPFVTAYKVIPVPFLSTVTVDLYFRDEDKIIVTYICSKSKLRKSYESRTAISSRICSKVKGLDE